MMTICNLCLFKNVLAKYKKEKKKIDDRHHDE